MRRRDFIPGLGASVAPTAWLSAAPAQRRPMQVIGYVSTITPEADAGLLNAFRQALRRDRLCRVACVDLTSSSPLLGLAVTYPENRSVRSLLSVWASTAPWLVSRTLPESLRPDCDLSRRSIIVPAICGGHRDAQRQRLRVARGLSAGFAARIGSLARDVHQSDEPLPEGNITLFYDFKYGGGGLHKRGTIHLAPPRSRARRSPAHRTAKQ